MGKYLKRLIGRVWLPLNLRGPVVGWVLEPFRGANDNGAIGPKKHGWSKFGGKSNAHRRGACTLIKQSICPSRSVAAQENEMRR